jgi:hypothetical protein
MVKKHFFLLLSVSFLIMICTAGIISAVIDADLRTNTPTARDIGVVPALSFIFLVFLILLLHLMPKRAGKHVVISGALKCGVLIGFLFFIPQSVLLYERTGMYFDSEIVHFSIYNILEAVLTRFVLHVLYGSRKSS